VTAISVHFRDSERASSALLFILVDRVFASNNFGAKPSKVGEVKRLWCLHNRLNLEIDDPIARYITHDHQTENWSFHVHVGILR
jgi:hypothetical protein